MLLKVSDKAVSKWENDLARPKSQLLYQLSTILGITLDELFAGEKYTGKKEGSCSVKEQHIIVLSVRKLSLFRKHLMDGNWRKKL